MALQGRWLDPNCLYVQPRTQQGTPETAKAPGTARKYKSPVLPVDSDAAESDSSWEEIQRPSSASGVGPSDPPKLAQSPAERPNTPSAHSKTPQEQSRSAERQLESPKDQPKGSLNQPQSQQDDGSPPQDQCHSPWGQGRTHQDHDGTPKDQPKNPQDQGTAPQDQPKNLQDHDKTLKDQPKSPQDQGTAPQDQAKRFLAFSDGPRSCVGQPLAYINVTATLAVLLANFHFRLADKVRLVHPGSAACHEVCVYMSRSSGPVEVTDQTQVVHYNTPLSSSTPGVH